MHERTLTPFTWVLPIIILFVATLASLPFVAEFSENQIFYTYYFASAVALPMALWWGPRVIFAAFFNALLACAILNLPSPHLYPLFALPITLQAFIGWALVRERLKKYGPWSASPQNIFILTFYGILVPALISSLLLEATALFSGVIIKSDFLSEVIATTIRQFFCGVMITLPLVILYSSVLFRKKFSLLPSYERLQITKISTNRQLMLVAALGISFSMSLLMKPQETWGVFALILLGTAIWSGVFYSVIFSSWFLLISGVLYKTQYSFSQLDTNSLGVLATIGLSAILCGAATTYVRTSQNTLKKTEEHLHEAREEALEASQAKTDFLERMSHELRSPLSSVLGTLELLKETDLNPEQQNYLKLFSHAGENLKALINDLLDYSNIEMKKIKLEEAPFNLKDTLKSVVEILQVKAEEKGVLFYLQIPQTFPFEQLGDGTRLRQIFFNLLGNAIKFSQSTEINLELSLAPNGNISITITDSGRGISRDAHSSRQGLGLVIARNLTETMGGSLNIQSQSGRGTTITLSLPNKSIEQSSKPQSDLIPDLKFLEKSYDHFRILLVDDSEDNRILIKYYLKRFQVDFTEAENGEEAVELFKSQKFDLVFMDMQMPKMTGYKATEIIRYWEEENATSYTPIIALTATALPDELEKTIKAGCDQYLVKPTSKNQILKILSERLKPNTPHISGIA